MKGIRAKLILGDMFPRQTLYVKIELATNVIHLPKAILPSTLFIPHGDDGNPFLATLIFIQNGKYNAIRINIHNPDTTNNTPDNTKEQPRNQTRTLTFDPLRGTNSTSSNTDADTDSVIDIDAHKHICNYNGNLKYHCLPPETHKGTIVAHTQNFNNAALEQAKSSYTPSLAMTDAPAYIGHMMQMMQSINMRLAALEDLLLERNSDASEYDKATGLVITSSYITLTIPPAKRTQNNSLHTGGSIVLLLPISHGNISMTFKLPCDIVKSYTSTNGAVWLQCYFWEMGADVSEAVAQYIFYHDRISIREIANNNRQIAPTPL